MQILVLGDDMKRTGSICILVIFGLVVTWLLITPNNTKNPAEKTNILQQNTETEAVTESSLIEENYEYIIVVEDEKLVVYYSDNKTIFLDTGISTNQLPKEVLSALKTGIRFQTKEDLFDFLESYSS